MEIMTTATVTMITVMVQVANISHDAQPFWTVKQNMQSRISLEIKPLGSTMHTNMISLN